MRQSQSKIRSIIADVLIALAAVAGATLIRLLFAPLLGYQVPLVTYPMAVLVAGYSGGLWAGMIATALGLVAAEFFFIKPAYTLNWPSPAEVVGLGLFAIVGISTSLICDALRRARRQDAQNAEALRRNEKTLRTMYGELERRVEARTFDLSRANESLQLEIAERKRAEEALRIREETLRQVVRVSDLGVFDHNQRTNAMQLSPKMKEICGWNGTEVVDLPTYLALIHPDDQERILAAIKRAHDPGGDGLYAGEHRIVRPDRQIRWLSVRSQTFFEMDNGGGRRPVRTIGVALDITERKQAEDALRESEARMRAALDNAPFDIWVRDREGRCIMENAATLEHWGPLYNKRPEETDIPEDVLRGWQENNRRAFAGEVVLGETEYIQQGQRRVYYTIVAPIRVGSEIHGILGFNLDITERKRAEMALRAANEALAEADRRKNEFLAMLAHELRNPLAPVRNAVQVLRIAGPPDPILARQRDIIERQVCHMARLVDDLLDVSRITRGRIELKKMPLHLAEVLVQAAEQATPLIETRGQKLALDFPPDDMCVEADPDRLIQAIGNLLANATKFTPAYGKIWLEATRTGEEAVIRVRDTGVGIAPEIMPRIFELFTQADQGLARSQGGLGIGLTMARQLVEMHGGRLEAHSAGLGQGSEFVIHLPAMPEKEQASTGARKSGGSLSEAPPRRILVVDDIADAADSLAEMLSLAGHEIRVAYDGPSALKMAPDFQPDVIILDIGMPGMDGYELASRMRLQESGKKALLIALTGYAQDCDRELARQAGFDHHLAKPVTLELLGELLAQPLAQPQTSTALWRE